MAYARIEPFGQEVEDFRAGQICAAVANFAGKSIPEGKADMTAADFISWQPREAEEGPEEEIVAHDDPVPDLEKLSNDILAIISGDK